MENIKARIKIQHIQGAELAYIYDYNILKELNIKASKHSDNEILINADETTLELYDKKYKVVKVLTKFLSKTFDDFGYGVSIHGIGEPLPFNFQVTYLVDDI